MLYDEQNLKIRCREKYLLITKKSEMLQNSKPLIYDLYCPGYTHDLRKRSLL